MDTRETALLLFVEMEKTKNFGSSLIRDTLNKYDYENPREKAFLKRLAEGTLESLLTLDYVINAYSKTPTNKMKPLIRSLLLDETFSALSLAERTAVQQRILTEIKGRMLEDIVLPGNQAWQTPRSRCLSCNSLWANLTWWCLTRRQAPAGFSRSSTARNLSRSSIAI